MSGAVVIREVRPGDRRELGTVAKLHMELLPFGPMAQFGARFVRDVCYLPYLRDQLLQVALCEVDGEAAGFVAFTSRSITFHRDGLRRHWVWGGLGLLRALGQDWRRVGRLVRFTQVLRSRRGEKDRWSDPLGEIVCLAVLPQFTAPASQRRLGESLSRLLVRYAADELRAAGVGTMRMVVDADNRAPLFAYHLMGARFQDVVWGGVRSSMVWFDLKEQLLD